MRRSMRDTPLVRSWFDYGFLKGLKEGLSASEYAEFVRWWNSRVSTGAPDSRLSSESSSE